MVNSNNVWLVTVAALASLMVLTASAQQFYANGRYGKRGEINVAGRGEKQFWTGSRYGRSNQHLVEVAPRNDRFFLGSRYGKRADSTLLTRGEESSSSGDIMAGTVEDDSPVTCMYTGITNLYRCFNRKDNISEDSSILSIHN